MRKLLALVTFSILSFLVSPTRVLGQEQVDSVEFTCAVYFTSIGCPHCAKTDPVVLGELLAKYPKLVVIEYEMVQHRGNAPLILDYDRAYGSGLGVPLVVFNQENHFSGDRSIIGGIGKLLEQENACPLIDGLGAEFESLDLNSLPGSPQIWRGDRVLVKTESGGDSRLLKRLLTADDVSPLLATGSFQLVKPKPVPWSGGKVEFDHAVKTNGWVFQWRGEGLPSEVIPDEPVGDKRREGPGAAGELTMAKILSLAAVDAVNPCALAVLALMLMAVVAYNPTKRYKVLLAGLAFTLSVFLMYLVYGLVIVRFFQLVQAIARIRLWLYRLLGLAAIGLGALNVKDFISYRPGSLGTEMPMGLRPRVKRILAGVTSPKGAVGVGVFVTVFLLPCTIGPYIITGGILSPLPLVAALPWLLLYNGVFVLPMLVITAIVFVGLTSAESVGNWKEKNIRYLHLTAGLIMLGLGAAMLLGLI